MSTRELCATCSLGGGAQTSVPCERYASFLGYLFKMSLGSATIGTPERGWTRLPDWLNPWWSDVRQIRSPLDEQIARNAIVDATGFLKGALGRYLLGKTLTVFRESWWHLRRPWVVARVTVAPASPGSVVTLRLGRRPFDAAFVTFFLIFALGGPLVFLCFAIAAVVGGHQAPGPWWVYAAWEAQDAGIYAACMALNSAAVRRDTAWLTLRITDLVSGTVVVGNRDDMSSERSGRKTMLG